jgi:hypothetical protein
MTGRARQTVAARLLEALVAEPGACLRQADDGDYRLVKKSGAWKRPVPRERVAALLSQGLLEGGPHLLRPAPAAAAWLRRRVEPEHAFLAQHAALERRPDPDAEAARHTVLVDGDESPLGALARRRDRDGAPFLPPEACTAAERLRADFERGQLQPRVTANWTAPINRGRRSGDPGGMAELTDAALAARQRFAGAVEAVGPELAGPLIDVCCLLKGLELVERERRWPARSAKLVLRLALAALARHYGLGASAEGPPGKGRVRHWGAEGYRPRIG